MAGDLFVTMDPSDWKRLEEEKDVHDNILKYTGWLPQVIVCLLSCRWGSPYRYHSILSHWSFLCSGTLGHNGEPLALDLGHIGGLVFCDNSNTD